MGSVKANIETVEAEMKSVKCDVYEVKEDVQNLTAIRYNKTLCRLREVPRPIMVLIIKKSLRPSGLNTSIFPRT